MSQSIEHAGRSTKKLRERKLGQAAVDSDVTGTPRDDVGQESPVLFLGICTRSNESIARTVVPGPSDQTIFECRFKAYQSLSSGWFRWKWVTGGIKFFRVRPERISLSIG